jgi:hypothetical protein
VYRLKYDAAAEAVHDSLPADAAAELTLALAGACGDPAGGTRPYGVDDGVMRKITTRHVTAFLLLGHNLKTVTVLQIEHLA